jgi:hypothetical protein
MDGDGKTKRNAALEREMHLSRAREARRKRRLRQYLGEKYHVGYTRFAAIRLAELNRLIDHWYGGPLSNDKDGRRLVEIVAMHFAALKRPGDRLHEWARDHAPWLTVAKMDTLIAKAVNRPIRWKADTLALAIRLTMADRTACRVTTIGAMDCSQAERLALRKAKNREAQRARRQARRMLKAVTG